MPDADPARAPERVVAWLDDLRRSAQRPRSPVDVEEAATRMRARFPALPREAAEHLVLHNTHEADGRRWWRFDPLHQTRAPQPTYVAQARAFWRRVACPVLFVEGGESAFRGVYDDLDERLATLRAHREIIAGAGHHPHLEQPEVLAAVVSRFLSGKAG